MRDARQFLEVASTLSYPKDKILLILNRAGRKADIKSSEIEEILNVKIFGTIPADENIALSSLNEGVPIILKKSHHPISRAIKQLAKDLTKTRALQKGE
jgi:pilus assembly protein CpaE